MPNRLRYKRIIDHKKESILDFSWALSGGVAQANCIAAYQAKGAASLAASYVNLINPGTYNAYPGTPPTWDTTTGWTFLNTSSQYLITDVVPATGVWSIIVRFANCSTNPAEGQGFVMAGSNSASPSTKRFSLIPRYQQVVSFHDYDIGSGGLGNGYIRVQPGQTSGVMAMAGNKGYLNGTNDATSSSNAGSPNSIYIGANHGDSGGIYSYYKGDIIALAIYNATLTGDQVTAITTAMNAL